MLDVTGIQIRADGDSVTFTGRLRDSAESAFESLQPGLNALGYVPLIRAGERPEESVIVAVRGRLEEAVPERNWINLGLFVLTLATMTLGGGGTLARMLVSDTPTALDVLANGLPFALALMAILAAHELGHFLQARRHGLPATLPFFIPLPFGLGTLGAFVQMRGAVVNKRALFDVAVGGPLAGLLVAIPLFVLAVPQTALAGEPLASARSLLVELLIGLFRPEASGLGMAVTPLLFAARIGLALTAMNLLPLGQLDGGHIVYAALGARGARTISILTIGVLIVIALFTRSTLWLIWMAFALISGAHRPTPLDDVTPLDLRRNIAFLATTALFLSLFTLKPF